MPGLQARASGSHLTKSLNVMPRVFDLFVDEPLYYTQALLARQRGDRDAVERAARAAIDGDTRLVVSSGWALPARELLDALLSVAPRARARRE